MTPDEAREQQQRAVHALPDLFVHACPGAGKTRTVVHRFIRVAESSVPRSVAAISFTNRAADEISERCASIGRPELAQFPHFVGTFDRFVATYIVRPFGDLGGPIRIIDSWDALDVSIPATGVQGTVSLDHFEISPDGVLRFEPRPGDPSAQGAALQRLEFNARSRYEELRSQGYITCDDARTYAVRLLSDHPEICDLLRERFAEIIVDEAQDCSSSELKLLELLREAGLPLVVVCDPHQSIYEWRDADPERFAAFAGALESIELDGNWRSTPSICRLAATIRGGPPDYAVGANAEDTRPVHLLRYGGWVTPMLGERFAALVTAAGLEPRNAVILAHQAKIAAQAAGAGSGGGQSNVVKLAIACYRLVDECTEPRKRQREFDRLQRQVLRLLNVDAVGHTTERAAELAGVSPMWLRRAALDIARTVGALDLDQLVPDWMLAARIALATTGSTADRSVAAPGPIFPTPANSADKTMREVLRVQGGTTGLRHSSVHKAKGTEESAVLVVVPRDRGPVTRSTDLVHAWEAGEATEAKRVLYVAVTRAEQFCAIAIPESLADRVVAILDVHEVPHDAETI